MKGVRCWFLSNWMLSIQWPKPFLDRVYIESYAFQIGRAYRTEKGVHFIGHRLKKEEYWSGVNVSPRINLLCIHWHMTMIHSFHIAFIATWCRVLFSVPERIKRSPSLICTMCSENKRPMGYLFIYLFILKKNLGSVQYLSITRNLEEQDIKMIPTISLWACYEIKWLLEVIFFFKIVCISHSHVTFNFLKWETNRGQNINSLGRKIIKAT